MPTLQRARKTLCYALIHYSSEKLAMKMIYMANTVFSKTAPLLVFVVLSLALAAQTNQAQTVKQQIKICRLPLTEIGASTSFRFQYIVKLTTKIDGTIENIQKIRWGGEEKIVNSENVIPCLKTWVLKPQKKYLVQINYGTTAGKNWLMIVNSTDRETMEIEL